MNSFLFCLLLLLLSVSLVSSQSIYTSSGYQSGPYWVNTFDVPLSQAPSPVNPISNYSWSSSLAGHGGVATLDGLVQYINATLMGDSYGTVLPLVIGGEMSFEYWVMHYPEAGAEASYSRIFDWACGSNACYNLINSNTGTTQTMQWEVMNSSTTSSVSVTNFWQFFTWQHVVSTVSMTPTAGIANFSVYLNGVPQPLTSITPTVTATAGLFLPPPSARPNSCIGKSNYANSLLNASIDTFAWYNYPLSAEAALAHAQVQKPPYYELVFAQSPVYSTGATNPTYSWQVDENPTDITNVYHPGIIILRSSQSNFIDMTNTAVNSGPGTALPNPWGGQGAGGNPSQSGRALGWTFEITFKLDSTPQAGACLYDMGSSTVNADDISLCFGSNSALAFTVHSTITGANPTTATVNIGTLTSNYWYHVVVVLSTTTSPMASYQAYVNGATQGSAVTGPLPNSVTRSNQWLGKSQLTTPTVYLDAEIDVFRVYDYAVPASSVQAIYATYMPPVTTTFTSGPTWIETFDVAESQAVLDNPLSNYSWIATQNGHGGIATLDGSGYQIINCTGMGDSYGNMLPAVIGGPMSFEYWVIHNPEAGIEASYSRVFDWACGVSGVTGACYNLINSNTGSTQNMQWEIMNSTTTSSVTVLNLWQFSTWQHVISTVAAGPYTGTGLLSVYLNGVLQNLTLVGIPMFLPPYAARPNSIIGKSNYAGNAYLNASIDTFAWYNYALSAEAAMVHAKLQKPPLYELTFAQSPQLATLSTTPTYSWSGVDVTDTASVSSVHTGLVMLRSASSQFIDLTNTNTNSGTGAAIPSTWGGQGAGGTPSQSGRALGWTFEVDFKLLNTPASGSCIYDMGTTTANVDEVSLCFGSNGALNFTVHSTISGATSNTATVNVGSVTLYNWYHVMVVLSTTTSPMASYQPYLNGIAQGNGVNGPLPNTVSRTNQWLGKGQVSGSSIVYLDVEIDAFRVYDYALPTSNVQAVYSTLASPFQAVSSSSGGFSSGSVTSATGSTGQQPPLSSSTGPVVSSATDTYSVSCVIIPVVVLAAMLLLL